LYHSVESLATFIGDIALHPAFRNVSVTLRKPSALPFASAAGVRVIRSHRDACDNDEIYIGLGSNLGNRAQALENALQAMEKQGIQVQDVSGLYESEPMYLEEQPKFLNAVCKVVLYISLANDRCGQRSHRKIYMPR
jgi:dihydroneopterin aldolase/2-amino-4-hydroxy-6-hydroxymethyldihydropteridine diphosphokinase/dihydropteroate synthase